jgi:glycine/D-amino acid oxidase-like deaminating enzyme
VAETGISTGFLQCGHLHLATTPARRGAQRREINFTRTLGMDKHEVSAAEVARMFPLADTAGLLLAIWSPNDGRANPVDVTLALHREPKANVERYDGLRAQIAGGRHAS